MAYQLDDYVAAADRMRMTDAERDALKAQLRTNDRSAVFMVYGWLERERITGERATRLVPSYTVRQRLRDATLKVGRERKAKK
jgi:hypothetical protein